MAEHKGGGEPEVEAEEALEGASATGVSLALGRTRHGAKEVDAEATAFLRDQRKLINLQTEHLHEQRDLQLVHLKVRRWKDRISMITQLFGMAAGAAVVLVVAFLVWNAAHADGLVIRPFSVPPALAERGVTGEAIAAQIMDRIGQMAQTARSSETQRQIAAAQNEVSIEIPETGISISQVEQWLTEKLGHERRITGELMARADGSLVLASRVGGVALETQRGAEAELPDLLQRTAEDLYAREQPNSYANFLNRTGRIEDLRRLQTARASSPDRAERARAYTALAAPALNTNLMDSKRLQEMAVALDVRAAPAVLNNLSGTENILGHAERSNQLVHWDVRLLRDLSAYTTLSPQARQQYLENDLGVVAKVENRWNDALALHQKAARDALLGFSPGYAPELDVVIDQANLHDIRSARQTLAAFQPENQAQRDGVPSRAGKIAIVGEDWPAALAAMQDVMKPWEARTDKGAYQYAGRANMALILTRLGRLDEAQTWLAPTPLDCVPCVATRGDLAQARGDTGSADHWMSEAVRMNPSQANMPYEWGQMLLKRGDYARAIAQVTLAARRAPKWADPLEGWGEALLKQGQAGAAAAKFKAAEDKFAPRWGRNHLYWGEALAAQGKTTEAKAQFTAAAGMDLTAAERAELAKAQAHG